MEKRKSLHRTMKSNKQQDIIYGIRAVLEAISEGKTLNKVLVQQGAKGELFTALMDALKKEKILYQRVPVQKLNHMVKKNHQGVIAMISPLPYHQIDFLIQQIYENGQDPFVLVLDRVKDVRNFGAICRTAECMGVNAIVIPAKESALITSDAIKTSAGALYKVPVCKVHHLSSAVEFLMGSGLKIYAISEKAQKSINQYKYNGPKALIMGSEEDGINQQLLKLSNEVYKVPMKGTIDSLNVSVATAIALYEMSRDTNA